MQAFSQVTDALIHHGHLGVPLVQQLLILGQLAALLQIVPVTSLKNPQNFLLTFMISDTQSRQEKVALNIFFSAIFLLCFWLVLIRQPHYIHCRYQTSITSWHSQCLLHCLFAWASKTYCSHMLRWFGGAAEVLVEQVSFVFPTRLRHKHLLHIFSISRKDCLAKAKCLLRV